MGAPLYDSSLLQHHDTIRIAHRGEAVGDDEGGSPLHQLVHAILDDAFGSGIDGGGGLIQDKDRRICNGRPGNGQKLALSLAEAAAVAGQDCVISLGQPLDKGIRIGQAGCRLHFLVGGIQFAETDIFPDRSREKAGILQHHTQRPPQIPLADMAHINPVYEDLPLLDIIEAIQEVGDGSLSGSGGSHKGNLLAGLGEEANVMQDDLLRHITEAYILHPHIPLQFPVGHKARLPRCF